MDELIKHYDKQVARESGKFIKELDEKYKNRKLNKTFKPSTHRSFGRVFRKHQKSESEKIGNKDNVVNRQAVQFNVGKKPRELWQEQSKNYDNKRRNRRNYNMDMGYTDYDTHDSEQVEIWGNSNKNRIHRSTVRYGSRCSWVNPYNQEIEEDSDLSENNDTMTTHFLFGVTQTPFQIMSDWLLKFRNNKYDSAAQFLDDLEIFKRGQIQIME